MAPPPRPRWFHAASIASRTADCLQSSNALGKEKVAVVRYGDTYLPSDLDGHIHITGSNHFKRGSGVAVGNRTKTEFGRWLHPHQSSNNQHRLPQPPDATASRLAASQLGYWVAEMTLASRRLTQQSTRADRSKMTGLARG